jgi:hypothetical protein
MSPPAALSKCFNSDLANDAPGIVALPGGVQWRAGCRAALHRLKESMAVPDGKESASI